MATVLRSSQEPIRTTSHVSRQPLDLTVTRTAPIAVIIPTYNRGRAVFTVLDRIHQCDPLPSEIWVHVDLANGMLEKELAQKYPEVKILPSLTRLGCSGGRHRGFLACNQPYAVSFDDDSYPIDGDFFSELARLFAEYPRAAVFATSIWHRHESPISRSAAVSRTASYVGCGHAVRISAYRDVRGLLPLAVGYGMEESDLSLQLFAAGWHVYEAKSLRVFHDTELKHHQSTEIIAGTITNVGLFAFLHYPLVGWGRGLLQIANKVAYCIRMKRLRGVITGLVRIPYDCYRHRQYRRPIPWQTVKRFLDFCKSGSLRGDAV